MNAYLLQTPISGTQEAKQNIKLDPLGSNLCVLVVECSDKFSHHCMCWIITVFVSDVQKNIYDFIPFFTSHFFPTLVREVFEVNWITI